MKIFKFSTLVAVCFAAAGCSSMGWNGTIFRDAFTPGVDAETSIRTWDNQNCPHVMEVQNEPAYLYDADQKKVQQ